MRSRGSQPRNEPVLSLTEWTAWQTPLQQVYYVDHSKRSRNFAEILEFCDFRRDCGDDDDSYDLEMLSFLNREDILQPGEREADSACAPRNGEREGNQGRKDVVVLDDEEGGSVVPNIARKNGSLKKSTGFSMDSDEEITNVVGINECSDDMAKKDGKSRRKRKSLDFGSDIDDDFECETNASTKTAAIDQNELHDSPAKKRLESSREIEENQLVSHPPNVKDNLTSANTLTTSRSAHSVDSDSYLSGLFDIPSSQRHRKKTRALERRNSEARISEDRISEMVPDAPSLDTLLDFSTWNAGDDEEYRSKLQEEKSDPDFLRSLLSETPQTSQNKTCDYEKRHVAESSEIELDRQPFSDEVGKNEQFRMKKADFLDEPRSLKNSENYDEQNVSGSKFQHCSSFSKTSGRTLGLGAPLQESASTGNTEKRNRNIRSKGKNKDDLCLEKEIIPKGKTSGTKLLHKKSKDFEEELLNSLFEDDLDSVICVVKTPCVFDDGQETLKNKKRLSNEQGTIGHSEHGKLYSGNKDARTHRKNVEKSCLFDDNDDENRISEEEISGERNERLISQSSKGDSCIGGSLDNKFNTSFPQRQPLVEQKWNSNISNESTTLKSRVKEHSLDRIRSFRFSKPATDQSFSRNTTTSEPHDLNLPEEYGPDVVAPSPLRVNPRRSYFGESFLMKSVCSEKGREMRASQGKRRMLKLKSKETSKELGFNETFQSDSGLKKGPWVQNNPLSTQADNTDKDTTQKGNSSFLDASLSLGKNKLPDTNDFPEKVKERITHDEIKNDKYPAFAKKSSPVGGISSSGRSQNKVEPNHANLRTSLTMELADEQLERTKICVCATSKSSREKSVCYEKDGERVKEAANEKPLYKSPSNAERISSGECRDQFGESRKNSGESLEDSPLVTRPKGKSRSKARKNRIRESDDECGVEFTCSDGEYGEHVGASFLGNQTKKIHPISDSDDEFDLRENLNGKVVLICCRL